MCDSDNQCFDGWPYTQNDGYLGQAAQNSSFTDADSVAVRDAVLKMLNPKQFSASYGHAFIRCGTTQTLHMQHCFLLCSQLYAAQGAVMPVALITPADLVSHRAEQPAEPPHRLINNGAAFTPAGPSKSKGVAITGWECANWVAGDGKNVAKNLVCKVGCR